MYFCEATSLEGFIQQIAANYLPHGYWFYVTGRIPDRKDPRRVDEKLIERYEINLSRWARARRKRLGIANLQYLRYQRFFVLLGTHGKHRFFEEEASLIQDVRRIPIKVGGYAISYRKGPDGKFHSHVRIDQRAYNELKAYFLEMAVHRCAEKLINEFWLVPYEPYAPVRRQLFNILRAVNRVRKMAGYQTLPVEVVPLKRRIMKPFARREEVPKVDPLPKAVGL